MKVVSFNIHSCLGVDGRYSVSRIAHILERLNPDVVALQEVTRGDSDQLQELVELWPCQQRFMKLVSKRKGEYGIAVLSRLEILDYTEHHLHKVRSPIPGEQRGLQSLLVRHLDHGEIRILNTHLALSRYHRLKQLQDLVRIIREETLPRILLCDLNCGPKSRCYRGLSQELSACSSAAEKTWPSFYPMRAIDHIFACDQLRLLHCFTDRGLHSNLASDHLPLVAEFTLDR